MDLENNIKEHLTATHFVDEGFSFACLTAVDEFSNYRPESLILMPLGITKTAREIVVDFQLGKFIPTEVFCDQDYSMGVNPLDARMIDCG